MKQGRIGSLDAVRAFACLSVMFFHMHLVLFGHMGVALFFVMSGFLSVYNHFDAADTGHITLKGSAAYARGKLIKLYPLYLLTLLIPLAVQLYSALNGLVPMKEVGLKTLSCVLLIQAWIPKNGYYFALNGPAWYLSSVAFSYFVFAYMLRGIKKLRSTRGALAAMLAIWLAQIALGFAAEGVYARFGAAEQTLQSEFMNWFTYISPVFRLGDFAFGGCVAYIFLHCDTSRASGAVWTAAELGAIALLAAVELGFENAALPFNDTAAFLPACAAVVYTFAVGRGHISRLLTNRVTKYISGISTEVFLTHAVVILACATALDRLPTAFETKQLIYVVLVPALSLAAALVGKRLNGAFAKQRRAQRVKI